MHAASRGLLVRLHGWLTHIHHYRADDMAELEAILDEAPELRCSPVAQHAGHLPGGAPLKDQTGRRVMVSEDAINRLKASHPAACIGSGLCERIGGRLYTRTYGRLHSCPPVSASRADAECEYVYAAFDYAAAPIGSRDWTLFWEGWQARAKLNTPQ